MSFDFSVVQDQGTFGRDVANPTVIKVIGCGGGGSSAVRRMIESNVQNVEFIVLNTDLQALNKSPAPVKVPIGQKLTGGLGAGGNPDVGESAAKEDANAIEQLVEGADMVIVTAGMGGGTGTGSIPVVAEIARKSGALTVAVVTTPFDFEGSGRMKNAQAGLEKLREMVDSLIVIPNEQVFKVIDKNINFVQAFQIADELLCQGIKGVSEIITTPGLVNLDFNDVKSVLQNQGDALLGVGQGEGENRGIDAAQMAISNPMLENLKMDGASKILVNITGPADVGMMEIKDIMNTITASANPENEIFWGQIIDESLGNKVHVTVIATGFKKYEPVRQSKIETPVLEKRTDPNVVSADEFAGMFGPISTEPVTSSTAAFEEPEEKKEGSSLGADLAGSFESVRPSFGSNRFSTPSGYSDMSELEKPACIRKQDKENGYSKSIYLGE
ncbi:MAG: cell division protein FtsZ [Treponema sp.]|nr:cell division protein FtsZ [Treponema sp.]